MANHYGESGAVGPKKPMSLWWPMGMLIAWIVFIAIGAGLIGGVAAQYSNCFDNSYYTTYSDVKRSVADCSAPHSSSPMFIGGAVCVVIGGICHLLFWILLVVWFVKRSNYRRAQNVYITQQQPAAVASPAYNNNNYQSTGYPQQQYQQQQQHYYNQQPAQQTYKA